ncbi:MAG: hypothetical protein JNL70_10020 [Saprospiraceae bacterium]|nr:hypothetical protein [Saprospiraceae bacterium]
MFYLCGEFGEEVRRAGTSTSSSSPPNLKDGAARGSTPKRQLSTKNEGSLSGVSKKRDQRLYDDLPKDKEGIDARRKEIKRESGGKYSKEQKEELKKLETQEKVLQLRNQQKRKN